MITQLYKDIGLWYWNNNKIYIFIINKKNICIILVGLMSMLHKIFIAILKFKILLNYFNTNF